jgi:hypothetical protein
MIDNAIPPITDPLGRGWRQPNPDSILVDDTHALMNKQSFWALANYSTTLPTGVYPGKMWRAHVPIDSRSGWEGPRKWVLRWFGIVRGNDKVCSCNQRDILIDEGLPEKE